MAEFEPIINLSFHQRIVGATQYERVDLRIFGKNLTQVFADEIFGSGFVVFAGFNQGNPHRTSVLHNR